MCWGRNQGISRLDEQQHGNDGEVQGWPHCLVHRINSLPLLTVSWVSCISEALSLDIPHFLGYVPVARIVDRWGRGRERAV